MTPRNIRRAAERKARKAAAKAAKQAVPSQSNPLPPQTDWAHDGELCWDSPEPTNAEFAALEQRRTLSTAQLAANRANALFSSGPRTAEGKAKVSLNAVKTGLTGHTVLLPSDDAAHYQDHLLAYQKEFEPSGPQESLLVQSLADTAWRLLRIPALEMAIYASGRAEFASLFENHDPAQQPCMIDLHTHLVYEKQLRNLQLQESRLSRRREKETVELRALQQERRQKEIQDLDLAAKEHMAAKHQGKPFNPAEFGFEFSTPEIEAYIQGPSALKIFRLLAKKEKNAGPRVQAA